MSADAHDTYHEHTPDEGAPMPEHGSHVSPKMLGITLIVMVLGVLIVILGLVVYFDSYMSSYRAEANESDELSAATWEEIQDKKASLEEYAWIDNETVRIPLDEAADRVLARYGSDEVASAETKD